MVNWKKMVWNLDCAPKVKLFVWKVLKGAIPVGERLMERHIDVDPKCKRCESSESIIHLLFQCQFARKVWQHAPLLIEMDCSGILDLVAVWPLLCNQKTLPPAGIVSGSLVPWVMWAMWKARNRFVFEGFSSFPEDTLLSAIRLAREWSLKGKPEISGPFKNRKMSKPVPHGTTVVRTDAAWCATSKRAGLGWIILAPFQKKTFQQQTEFVSSPLMAEGLALREAVLTCRRMELRNLRFESDSIQLIKCISSCEVLSELHSVVSDILELSCCFDSFSFEWIPREKNMEADGVAKGALTLFEPLVGGELVNPPN